MTCLADNERMQAVARKHDAGLRLQNGEVTGDIVPVRSSYFSFLEDVVEDRAAFVHSFLDLQTRLAQSA